MRRAAYAALVPCALVLCALALGCSRSEGKQPSPKLAKYVLEQPPADVGRKLDASFDGKITLLGARVEAPPNPKYKDKVKLTLYWRSEEPVDDDVRLSTHLLDGAGKQIHEIDFIGPLRRLDQQTQRLGPGRWKPGHVYVDEQSFKIPTTRLLKTQKLEIAVSLADGEERLPVVRGAHDVRNRVKVGELSVTRRPVTGAAPAPASAAAAAAAAKAPPGAPAASGVQAAPAASATSSSAIAPTKPPATATKSSSATKLSPVKVPLKAPPTPAPPKASAPKKP